MRSGLLTIGVLFVVGGFAAIFRPMPYFVAAHPNPTGDIAFSEPKEEASTHKVNSRLVGYGAAGFGFVVILTAISLKQLSVPKPHGHPLPESDC